MDGFDSYGRFFLYARCFGDTVGGERPADSREMLVAVMESVWVPYVGAGDDDTVDQRAVMRVSGRSFENCGRQEEKNA
jgi:hypothetical protein